MDSRWSLPLWIPAFAGMTKGAGTTKNDYAMRRFKKYGTFTSFLQTALGTSTAPTASSPIDPEEANH